MPLDLTPLVATDLARNRGPDPDDPDRQRVPHYGVAAGWDDGVVSVVLTFRRGYAYCCFEAGCHVAHRSREWWEWLRRELAARELDLPARLKLRLDVVVEEGALFFDHSRPDPGRRGRYAFAPADGYRYRVEIEESARAA